MPAGAAAQGLASGQLPDAKGTLFTATRYTEVTFFSIVNGNSGAEAVVIYVKRSGGSSRSIWTSPTLAAGASSNVIDGGSILILNPGDLIEGVTTTAAKVDYDISGRIS